MTQEYVPIKDSQMTQAQLDLKQTWDAEWKAGSDARAATFYTRKRQGKTTAKEESDFLAEDAALWAVEEQRRIDAGLYRHIEKAELQTKLDRLTAESAEIDATIKAMV